MDPNENQKPEKSVDDLPELMDVDDINLDYIDGLIADGYVSDIDPLPALEHTDSLDLTRDRFLADAMGCVKLSPVKVDDKFAILNMADVEGTLPPTEEEQLAAKVNNPPN